MEENRRFKNRKNAGSGRGRVSASSTRQTKLTIVFALLLVVLAALAVRLIYIVREHGTEYQKAVLQNQSYDSTILPFK